MIIKKAESKKVENSPQCTIWEYKIPSAGFSIATAVIDGRYPEEKRATNTACEEVYYVLSGTGIVHSEKGEFEVEEGDVYFFEKGEVFWVEGRALRLVLVNVPKWKPEQHNIVE